MDVWFTAIAVGFPILWIFGIHVNDLARITLMVLVSFGLLKSELVRRSVLIEHPSVSNILWFALVIFVLFSATQSIFEVYLGRHGIDFAIFSQVVDSIVRRGEPTTSLIGLDWKNFFSHHFVPYLYLPGILTYLGVPAYFSLSIVHAVGVAAALLFAGAMLPRIYQEKSLYGLLAATLLLSHPTFRHGILFGVHDEVFALPFIGGAYFYFLKSRHNRSIALLLVSTLTKETLFLVVAAFGVMAIIDIRMNRSEIAEGNLPADQNRDRNQIKYLVLCIYALVGFASYVFLQPILLGKAFDHAGRLVNFSEFFRLDWLIAKTWWVVFIGLPFLWFPLWRVQTWHLILPALPSIGLVTLSNFDEMWKPMNYYAVMPVFIIALASIASWARARQSRPKTQIPSYLIASLVAVSFCWSGKKPSRLIFEAFTTPLITPSQLSFIPESSKVITGPAGALMLFRTEIVYRLWIANRNQPTDFDFIVTLRSESSEIGPELIKMSYKCFENELWLIRCNPNSAIKFGEDETQL